MEKNYNAMRAGKTDGRLFPVTKEDLLPGAVLRMVTPSDGSVSSFSDFVVVGWTSSLKNAVRLARPYAFVSGAGTTSPTVLTGVEYLEVTVERLLADNSQFSAVVQSTGLVAEHLT